MEGTIMLMPASEAWKKVEESIADDMQKIEDAVDEAIRDRKATATVDRRVIKSEAVQEKLTMLGYRFGEDAYHAYIHFSHEDQGSK